MNETQEMRRIYVFDTTLRDGEQSPGCTMNLRDKLLVAEHLEALRVDVIEAGFTIASSGDFESVKAIAGIVKNASVASLCRALPKDIDSAWEAVRGAAHPRIHTFIATSPIHMEYKLKMTPDAVYDQAVAMVKYARNLCGDVEFSLEDCSRSERPFIYRIVEGVIAAGAKTVNIPDTVGYAVPEQFGQLITGVDHWLVFGLLGLIGGKMICDALKGGEEAACEAEEKLDIKELIVLSFATSIDALAVGISFAFLKVKILPSVSVIGVTTCLLSILGVAIGQRFGAKYRDKATLAGGIVLVLIGLKILLEHLGVFG